MLQVSNNIFPLNMQSKILPILKEQSEIEQLATPDIFRLSINKHTYIAGRVRLWASNWLRYTGLKVQE